LILPYPTIVQFFPVWSGVRIGIRWSLLVFIGLFGIFGYKRLIVVQGVL